MDCRDAKLGGREGISLLLFQSTLLTMNNEPHESSEIPIMTDVVAPRL
jgi:hypothetical protein